MSSKYLMKEFISTLCHKVAIDLLLSTILHCYTHPAISATAVSNGFKWLIRTEK